jgi:hypothetical protein
MLTDIRTLADPFLCALTNINKRKGILRKDSKEIKYACK